jgi:peroxiredoxin Q/BCP
MAKISLGKKVSDFTLTDKDGGEVSLKDFKGKKKVIYFYPKDDTPGCTIESKEFSDALAKFKRKKTVVIGISGGTDKTKKKFCEKYNLAHILLTDSDFSIAKQFNTYGKKKFMGREYMGIFRKTFVLSEDNKIIALFEDVSPKGHADEVLGIL